MHVTKLCLTAVVVFSLAFAAVADEKKEEVQEFTPKAEKVPRAKFIDFCSELGLPIASLDKLGERIDNARLAADPVELAVAAKLLQAAESVAGKSASLNSKSLMGEAVKLAKLRSSPAELRTVAKLASGDDAEDLEALAKNVEKKEKDTPKDLDGHLTVDNHSHGHVRVYIDGHYHGDVNANSVRSFRVHHARNATVTNNYGHRWTAQFEFRQYRNYRMTIRDQHNPH